MGHEVPIALLPSPVTSTLGGSVAALGMVEAVSDGLSGVARLAGGALADDPKRRRAVAVDGYIATTVLSSLIGAATSVWQVAILRAVAWTARGLRMPARTCLVYVAHEGGRRGGGRQVDRAVEGAPVSLRSAR